MSAAIALPPLRQTGAADSGDSMAALDHVGAVMTLRRDEQLFFAGDTAAFYFKVLKGGVRACKLLDDGRRHIGDFFLPGDFIGFDSGKTYAFAAEAIVATTLVRYSRQKVDALAAEQPGLAQTLIEIMRTGLIAARERLVSLGQMTAMERIALFLLRLSDRAADARIVLPMTRTDIGDHLGLTMETVSRALSQLKNKGIVVQTSLHELVLADRDALLALARP